MVPTKLIASQIVCDWGSRERLSHLAYLHVTCVILPSKQASRPLPCHPPLGPDARCLSHVWCSWDISMSRMFRVQKLVPGSLVDTICCSRLTLNSIIEGEEKTESSWHVSYASQCFGAPLQFYLSLRKLTPPFTVKDGSWTLSELDCASSGKKWIVRKKARIKDIFWNNKT